MSVSGNYCSNCGQRTDIGRITFRETVNHFLSAYLSFEGSLSRTTTTLILNPGKLFREYLAGKRRTYYTPASYFILLTAVYLILRDLIGYDPLIDSAETETPGSAQTRYMISHLNSFLFLMVFSIGLVWKIFFPKRYYHSEFLGIGFYIGGFYILVITMLMLINSTFDVRLSRLSVYLTLAYMIFAMASTFGFRPWWRWFQYIIASVATIALYAYSTSFLAYVFVEWL